MDKTTTDNLMYIAYDDLQNYPFYKLQLVVKIFGYSTNKSTKQNSLIVPTVVIKHWGQV